MAAMVVELQTFRSMHQRCGNPRHEAYANYGGRGISICRGWSSPDAFMADMGPRPAGLTATGKSMYSLDRINNDGGYWCGKCDECISLGRPANCRWATRMEQSSNRRQNGGRRSGGTTKRPPPRVSLSDDLPLIMGPVMRYIAACRRSRLAAEGAA